MATRLRNGFLILLALLALGGEAWAQIRAEQLENPPIPDGHFDDLPASPTTGMRFVVDDCLTETCEAGGGSLVRELRHNGSEWVVLSGGTGSTTIDQGFDAGDGTISGANEGKPLKIYDADPDEALLFRINSLGVPEILPVCGGVVNDCDRILSHNSGKKTELTDSNGDPTWRYSESTGRVTYPTAAKAPLGTVWFGAGSLSTDGTQCAAPAEATINSGPKLWTIICTDNDASTIYGSIGMPDSWDGGTVTFEHQYIQTAADTGVLNGDIAAQCRGAGEVPSSTWGTEVAIDDAAVTGSNAIDHTTSGAVTPAGTCAGGDTLFFRYQLDAGGTTTAVATLHHVGFKMEYSKSGNSD